MVRGHVVDRLPRKKTTHKIRPKIGLFACCPSSIVTETKMISLVQYFNYEATLSLTQFSVERRPKYSIHRAKCGSCQLRSLRLYKAGDRYA